MKKGEIAINVIIIIALGLIVLTILAVLLVGAFSDANRSTNACEETYNGECRARSTCLGDGGRVIQGVTCSGVEGQISFENRWSVDTLPVGGGVCCVGS